MAIRMEADVPYKGVPRLIALVTLMTMNALGVSAVLAQDSFRAVCSGFVENTNNPSKKMGISVDFFDQRFGSGSRKYTLSSVYQLKLWQGMIIGSGDNYKGTVVLKNGWRRFFSGKFNLTNGAQGYAMSLDGRLSQDPGISPPFVAIATLPCVHLTP